MVTTFLGHSHLKLDIDVPCRQHNCTRSYQALIPDQRVSGDLKTNVQCGFEQNSVRHCDIETTSLSLNSKVSLDCMHVGLMPCCQASACMLTYRIGKHRFNCVLILSRAWEFGLEADRDRNSAVSITYAFQTHSQMRSSGTYTNCLQCAASPSGADTLDGRNFLF